MKHSQTFLRAALALSLSLGLFSSAHAKVIFTGYADLRFTPYGEDKLGLSPAAQTTLGIPETKVKERGYTIDSLGFFATTYFNDRLGFSADVTYRQIGFTTKEIRLQYAYLLYEHPSGFFVNVGKITLPLGYYNTHYFYPFQRYAINAPIYQSSILGLPIADVGVEAGQTFGAEPVKVKFTAYSINGYGSANAAGTTFRPGLGAVNALIISNNLGATNNNGDLAYGTDLQLQFFHNQPVILGGSLYYGPWSNDGQRDFWMVSTYGHLALGPVDFLAEYLYTKTENDLGVTGFFGVPDWESNGMFLEGSYLLYQKDQQALHGILGAEYTGAGGNRGGVGKEVLRNYKTGLAYRMNEFLTLKTELSRLEYNLPVQVGGSAEHVGIDRNLVLLSLTVTY